MRTRVSFDVVMKSGVWGDITKVKTDPLLLPLLLEKKNLAVDALQTEAIAAELVI